MSPVQSVEATLLSAAASELTANAAEIEAALGSVNVTAVTDLENLAKNEEGKLGPVVAFAIGQVLNLVPASELEALLASGETSGIATVAAALNAAAAKLKAA